MKKLALILLVILSVTQLKAQSFEFSIQANSGVSHFTGGSTLHTTFFNAAGYSNEHAGYPNGVGDLYAPDLGVSLQVQYNFKCGVIIGAQAGFEQFSSRVGIDTVYGSYNSPVLFTSNTPYQYTTAVSATGHVTDHWYYVNFNPYTGYRFLLKKVKLDVLPGFDIAFGTGSSETVNVKAGDNSFYNKSTLSSEKPITDVRPRIGLAAYYQRFGITASYSEGVHDYNSGKASDSVLPTLRTELFRLGISYRIN